MNKKIMKIRLRKDGTWENIYEDGTPAEQFYELNPESLADMYTQQRTRKLQEYMILQEIKDNIIEDVIEHRGMPEATEVINRIKNL